jgi:hypothetical protein
MYPSAATGLTWRRQQGHVNPVKNFTGRRLPPPIAFVRFQVSLTDISGFLSFTQILRIFFFCQESCLFHQLLAVLLHTPQKSVEKSTEVSEENVASIFRVEKKICQARDQREAGRKQELRIKNRTVS